ncbi:MAG TPA: transposase [Candidatus Thermoplasmatota archaeon]|nr:transposase [Candidatus Thermoplasmatota archaeon]
MPLSYLPAYLSAWLTELTGALDKRSAPRLLRLLIGALFARGRRTVTSWFRAAGITDDFRPAYSALWAAGRRASALTSRLLGGALLPLMRQLPGDRWLFAIDDSPTPRYGPCVQGAGIHHNPTPGPAGEKFVYGHVWVTLAWLARHPAWDTLALPLRALLYVRAKDVPVLAQAYPWDFHTKLALAVELARWLVLWLGHAGRALWLAVDGAYAKRPFLKPVLALGVVVVSRLRKDADLRALPPTKRRPGQRGPLPTYGKEKIDLAKRAGQKRGWQQVACVQYGERVVKTIKTFLATWRPAGGVIRVVLVREDNGWRAYFCTDPLATAEAILEAMADRGAIEQTFKDVKEVWGAGQQQVRNVYACLGALTVNLLLYSVVEAWAWARAEDELVDRSRSPWDEADRRPSHADKRKALQREILREEIRAVLGERAEQEEFQDLATRLLELAA